MPINFDKEKMCCLCFLLLLLYAYANVNAQQQIYPIVDDGEGGCLLNVSGFGEWAVQVGAESDAANCTLATEWEVIRECNATCGVAGVVVEAKAVLAPSRTGGYCPFKDRVRMVACDALECESCVPIDWGEIGPCLVSGKQLVNRTVCVDDEPELEEIELDCLFNHSTQVVLTDVTFEGGDVLSQFGLTFVDASGIVAHRELHVERPEDTYFSQCEVSEWSPWSPCSQTCDGMGRTHRFRDLLQVGRLRCYVPVLQQTEECGSESPCVLRGVDIQKLDPSLHHLMDGQEGARIRESSCVGVALMNFY